MHGREGGRATPKRFPWRGVVLLPTFNERLNLRALVTAILRRVDIDILVIDDDSPDGTGLIADELRRTDGRVHVLHRGGRHGLGTAYLAGFAWALQRGYQRIVEMDCDFSHAPRDLPRLLRRCGRTDLVIGSRYVRGGSTEGWSPARRLLSRAGNVYCSLLLGPGVRDWTSGFRVFGADVLRRIDLDGIQATGFGFQIEMTWRTKRVGARVREVPVRFEDRRHGRSKMSGSIALEALRLVPRLRTGRGTSRC